MQWQQARERFIFLDHAFDGEAGFAPRIVWRKVDVLDEGTGQVLTTKLTPALTGPSELVRYPRESEEKFAARNAVALYENHLRTACERFVGFLGRRKPQRQGTDAPLVSLMAKDCDLRGTDIDSFWRSFALQAKARGSMLLVIDKHELPEGASLADQQRLRAVPYIRYAEPEHVVEYEIDDTTGLFSRVVLEDECMVEGEIQCVQRVYDASSWQIVYQEKVIEQGVHAFGACPVLAFTESGDEFPVIGKFAQIADISRRIFNARSEQDEILRSQTFSLLTLQVPAEQSATFDAATVSATIGTHSMLVHGGDQPAFIAPDPGPAATYETKIAELQQSIRRIAMEESTEVGTQAESGVARRLRFEALNADICSFAFSLQQLETRMWALWHKALGIPNNVTVSWPTDYNLADVTAELDILALMQATGFPEAVLTAKRRAVAAVEFDNADEDTKAEIEAAFNEAAQSQQQDPTNPAAPPVRTGATA